MSDPEKSAWPSTNSILPFFGAKNFSESRKFYKELNFQETVISNNMSRFQQGATGFYLQDYYVKDWINNSMLFLEVSNVEKWLDQIHALGLVSKYDGVKLSRIHQNDWGMEFFLHDPSGILWHIGKFH